MQQTWEQQACKHPFVSNPNGSVSEIEAQEEKTEPDSKYSFSWIELNSPFDDFVIGMGFLYSEYFTELVNFTLYRRSNRDRIFDSEAVLSYKNRPRFRIITGLLLQYYSILFY